MLEFWLFFFLGAGIYALFWQRMYAMLRNIDGGLPSTAGKGVRRIDLACCLFFGWTFAAIWPLAALVKALVDKHRARTPAPSVTWQSRETGDRSSRGWGVYVRNLP